MIVDTGLVAMRGRRAVRRLTASSNESAAHISLEVALPLPVHETLARRYLAFYGPRMLIAPPHQTQEKDAMQQRLNADAHCLSGSGATYLSKTAARTIANVPLTELQCNICSQHLQSRLLNVSTTGETWFAVTAFRRRATLNLELNSTPRLSAAQSAPWMWQR